MIKIPTKIETYEEGSVDPHVHSEESMIYSPNEGEDILVTTWVRYPTYDFIFGTPAPDNPHFGKEYGFFCFRKKNVESKDKPTAYWSVYVDQSELDEMQQGWTELAAVSRLQRPIDWQNHERAINKS